MTRSGTLSPNPYYASRRFEEDGEKANCVRLRARENGNTSEAA